jgi:hypothetical protein
VSRDTARFLCASTRRPSLLARPRPLPRRLDVGERVRRPAEADVPQVGVVLRFVDGG